MKTLFFFFLSVFSFTVMSLESCPEDPEAEWHNCEGSYQYSSGETYSGEWQNNLFHGRGSYAHSVGQWETDLYVGDFKEDKKNGFGIYTYTDGVRYVGEFKDDMKDGKGKYLFLDGTTKQLKCSFDKCEEI